MSILSKNTIMRNKTFDDIAGASIVLSLKKLKNSYNGPCLKLRRSSDNAEQDFYFDSNNELDAASISTWLSVDTAYIVKWYDQSGWGNDAVQYTQSQQPVFDNNNQKIIFNSFNLNFLSITHQDSLKPRGDSFSLIFKASLSGYINNGSSVNDIILKNSGTFSAPSYGFLLDNSQDRMYFKTGASAGTTSASIVSYLNSIYNYFGIHTENTGQEFYINDTLMASGISTNPINNNTGDLYIGGGNIEGRYGTFDLYSVSLFDKALSSSERILCI